MNNARRETLVRVMVGLLVLLVIALAAVLFTVLQGQNQPDFAEPAVSLAATTEPATDTPIPATDTPSPTAEPSPSTEPDLRFGAYPLAHSCDAYTKLLVRILEDELGLNVETVMYQGPAPLFADLAEAKLDYTICFAGLDHRQYLDEYFGYIKVYDNRFLEENEMWMQPVIAAQNLNDMRNDRPCVHDLMEKFKFTAKDRYSTVNNWFEDNGDLVEEWVDCQ